MTKKELRKIKSTFCRQQDKTDCGVACLRSICRYYGADHSLESIRQICGCGLEGTSMLGLQEAATQLNFHAEGFEMNVNDLEHSTCPVILHVTINAWQHYVVCYGRVIKEDRALFVIGDPAKGIQLMDEDEIESTWRSHAVLLPEPRERFYQSVYNTRKEKRQWILSILKSHFPILAITSIIGIAVAALGLSVSIFSQQLIDRLLPSRKLREICLGIVLVTTLLLIREVLTVIRNRLMLTEGKKIHFGIGGDFFTKMLHLPFSFFSGRTIGDLTSRLHDTARIQRVIIQLFGNSCIDLLVVIVSFFMIFLYSPVIAVGCLVFSPLYFWIVLRGQKPIQLAQQQMFESNAGNESMMVDILKGVHAVRQNNRQIWFTENYKKQLENYLNSIVKLGFNQSDLFFQANIAGTILIGIIIAGGSYQVFNGSLQTGEFIAILSITANLLPGIASLAASVFPISEGMIAFNRLFECQAMLKDAPNDRIQLSTTKHAIPETISSIEFKSASFRFPGKPLILKDIDCRFEKGVITGLTGTNGCGKTSLAGILMKEYHPNDGRIVINSQTDITSIGDFPWRNLVAMVPQQIHLFNGTVLENIAFEDAKLRKPFVMEFLKKVGLLGFISMLPNGTNTIIGEKGVRLSGGQQQMIGWARALYRKPEVLILDEAFSNLDATATGFFLTVLQSIKHSMIIVVITHQQEVLRLCDEVLELRNGRLTIVDKSSVSLLADYCE